MSDYRAQLQQDGDTEATGSKLAQPVWTPLESLLDGNTTVLLAPDGDLNFLPWARCPTRARRATTCLSGTPWPPSALAAS